MNLVNGPESWVTTHHEIVAGIHYDLDSEEPSPTLKEWFDHGGQTVLYSIAIQWTDEFEEKNRYTDWDLDKDFWLEVDAFLTAKLSE